jgi:hypothetical protein
VTQTKLDIKIEYIMPNPSDQQGAQMSLTKEELSQLGEAISDKARDTVYAAGDGLREAKERTTGAFETDEEKLAREKAEKEKRSGLAKAGDAIRETGQTIKESVTNPFKQEPKEDERSGLTKAGDAIKDTAIDAKESTAEFFSASTTTSQDESKSK